ncbi:hypothetical protein RND81_08G183600 [Saponaria officinalis]|uniref:F-box domain-containing protein n=1 Tax=Saponaria officinalis TaxID=3572 RepID=A0AAW1J877_SAPOF
MANIPEDILHLCILPRLPVKSVIRFKCVSKSWQTLISSPNFIRLHHCHTQSSDTNRLIISANPDSTYFHIYNLDSLLDPPSIFPYPITEILNFRVHAIIVTSCGFFLLIQIRRYRKSNKLILLNPSTRSYHLIPSQNLPHDCLSVKFGLYLDEDNDDYKIVRISSTDHPQDRYTWETMIYSFKTNSWRLIETKVKSAMFYTGNLTAFVVNNLLHIFVSATNRSIKTVRIGCFDIRAEQWTNDIALPNYNLDEYSLHVLDGSICVIGDEYEIPGIYSVWVMKDDWVKLMSTRLHYFRYNQYYPITYRPGSRHELLCKRNGHSGFYWYDLQDKVGRYAASYNDAYARGRYCIEHVCKGSLITFANKLQIPFRNNIYNNEYT